MYKNMYHIDMTKCRRPRNCFRYDKSAKDHITTWWLLFTTYDLTTFTTSRLVIDLETGFTVQKWASRWS